MKPYISIDIETTGLDEDTCQVIEFAAVIDDLVSPVEDLPVFRKIILHDYLVGQPYAMSMHSKLFIEMDGINKNLQPVFESYWCRPGQLSEHFMKWCDVWEKYMHINLHSRGKFIVSGKNFAGFDWQFLKPLPGWEVPINHRIVDVGMLYFDILTDDLPPSTLDCMRRAGLVPEAEHTAKGDARDVVRLIRRKIELETAFKQSRMQVAT